MQMCSEYMTRSSIAYTYLYYAFEMEVPKSRSIYQFFSSLFFFYVFLLAWKSSKRLMGVNEIQGNFGPCNYALHSFAQRSVDHTTYGTCYDDCYTDCTKKLNCFYGLHWQLLGSLYVAQRFQTSEEWLNLVSGCARSSGFHLTQVS